MRKPIANTTCMKGHVSLQITLFFLATTLSLMTRVCIAEEISATDPCANIRESQQIDECTAKQYTVSDQNLNAAYKKLISKIDVYYKADPKIWGQFRSTVKQSQVAWIKFRDANCELIAFEIEKGSPAYTTTRNRCLSRMTEERTHEIEKIL